MGEPPGRTVPPLLTGVKKRRVSKAPHSSKKVSPHLSRRRMNPICSISGLASFQGTTSLPATISLLFQESVTYVPGFVLPVYPVCTLWIPLLTKEGPCLKGSPGRVILNPP